MSDTEAPDRYIDIIRLLKDCSGRVTEGFAEASSRHKAVFNVTTASFEVDVLFVFLLSFSLVNHRHNRQVLGALCSLGEDYIIESYGDKISCTDLREVIGKRIDGYLHIANASRESGEDVRMQCLQRLDLAIAASSYENRIEAVHPIVIGDALADFDRSIEFNSVYLRWTESFGGALHHIFEAANDVRTLSEEQFRALARAGQEEALARLNRAYKSTQKNALPKKKRWWQFWYSKAAHKPPASATETPPDRVTPKPNL